MKNKKYFIAIFIAYIIGLLILPVLHANTYYGGEISTVQYKEWLLRSVLYLFVADGQILFITFVALALVIAWGYAQTQKEWQKRGK